MASADGKIVIDIILEDGKVAKGVADVKGQLGQISGAAQGSTLSVGKLAGALGLVAAAKKGIDMVKGSMDKAFGRIDTFERFDRVMTVLTGSQEEAKAALDRTNEAVTGTAYGLDVAASAVQGFVARSLDVNKSTSYIESFGDAVAFFGEGTNEAFESVTRAMQDAVSSGKVSGDVLNTLYSQGIQGPEMYAAATGKSLDSVRKDLSSGAISAEEFFDVLDEVFREGTEGFPAIEGAAKEAGASWTSVFGNMQTAIARGTASIIESIDEVLTSNGLPDMRSAIADFGKEFEKVLKSLAEKIPEIAQWIFDLYQKIKPFIPLLTTVAVAVGAFVASFAAINSVIGLVMKVRNAFMMLNMVLMLNPYVAIAAAAVAAVVLIIKYWGPIKSFFSNLWSGIKDAASKAWDSISQWGSQVAAEVKQAWNDTKQFFSDLWQAVKDSAKESLDNIKESWNNGKQAIQDAWDGLKEWFSEMWTSIGEGALAGIEAIQEYWSNFKEFITELFTSMVEKIVEVLGLESAIEKFQEVFTHLQDIVGLFIEYFQGQWETIVEFLTATWDNITTIAQAAWEGIKLVILGPILVLLTLLTEGWGAAGDMLQEIWTRIKEVGSTIWNAMKDQIMNIIDTWISLATNAWNHAIGIFSAAWEAIKAAAQAIWEAMKNVVTTIVETTINGLVNTWESGKRTVINIWNLIKTTASTVWNAIKTTVVNLVTGMVNLVKNWFENLKTGVTNIMTNTKTAISNKWEEIKTSAAQIVSNMISDLISKWEELKTKTLEKIKQVKENVINPLKEIDLLQIGKDVIQGFIDGIKSKVSAVADAAKDAADAVTGKIKSILNIHSPSRVTKGFGVNTIEGFILGLEQTKEDLKRSVEDTMGVVEKTVSTQSKRTQESLTEHRKKIASIERDYNERLAKEGARNVKEKKAQLKKDGSSIAKIERDYQEKLAKERSAFQKQVQKMDKEHQKEILDNLKNHIQYKKEMGQLSLIQEAALWKEQLNLFKEGTEERIAVQKEYYKAVEDVQKKVTEINEHYGKKMNDINKKLHDEENRIWDEFVAKREQRGKDIANFAKLFDEFVIEQEVSGEQLLDNLKSQVVGLEEWMNDIEQLESRLSNKELKAELAQMGPEAAGEIKALLEMTEEQLAEYEHLYWKKFALARVRAGEETSGMRDDVFNQIDAMRVEANTELDLLAVEWITSMKELTTSTNKELMTLEQIGRDAGRGLYNGLASMEKAIVDKATSIAEAVKEAMSSALDIHSPSRWMRDFIAGNLQRGFEIGVDRTLGDYRRSGEQISSAIQDPLNQRIGNLANPGGFKGLHSRGSSHTIVNNSQMDNSGEVNYNITNHFTPEESTPAEHSRKQEELLYLLSLK